MPERGAGEKQSRMCSGDRTPCKDYNISDNEKFWCFAEPWRCFASASSDFRHQITELNEWWHVMSSRWSDKNKCIHGYTFRLRSLVSHTSTNGVICNHRGFHGGILASRKCLFNNQLKVSQAASLQEECLHRGAFWEREKGGERFIVGERRER